MKKLIFCAALACILTTGAKAQTVAPFRDGDRVVFLGNSITDGHGIPQPDANGYPAILGRRLGDGYLVRNFGVSGRTMLCKGDQPYMATDVYQRCKEFNPDIVVVKLGTNDSKPQNWRHKISSLFLCLRTAGNMQDLFH